MGFVIKSISRAVSCPRERVRVRGDARDRTLGMPRLILPSIQVDIRAGHFPEPEANGVRYLKIPVDAL